MEQHIRYITVPKDKDAEIALDYDTAKPEQLIEWELSQEEFVELWNLQIFDKINSTCDTIIDDYEDESITEPNSLYQCSIIINQTKNYGNGSVKRFSEMVRTAIDLKTGLYFYF